MIGLALAVQVDRYLDKKQRRIMLTIVALILSLISSGYWGYQLSANGGSVFIRTCLSAYGYSARPVLLILFGDIVSGKGMTGRRGFLWGSTRRFI